MDKVLFYIFSPYVKFVKKVCLPLLKMYFSMEQINSILQEIGQTHLGHQGLRAMIIGKSLCEFPVGGLVDRKHLYLGFFHLLSI